MIKKLLNNYRGFTLVELMVVISIIGILSAIVYANFSDARKAARDEIRITDLKNLQLAIELYKAQNGVYPLQGGGCTPFITWTGPGPLNSSWGCSSDPDPNYIVGLVPDYIAELPTDPNREYEEGSGFIYRTNVARTDYKLMSHYAVEKKTIKNYNDEYARCPAQIAPSCPLPLPNPYSYAVYSAGAADW
jgi:prepilin-type N-terminal cleavage/methylation domain-containing protein